MAHPRVRKFGYNPSVKQGGGEDVVSMTGTVAYAWPSAAASTFIVSSSTNDKGPSGTGALVCEVFGVDQKMAPLSQKVTLNGTTSVALTDQYFRVFRAYVHECGSGGVNAGTLSIKHGAAVVAEVPAGMGQTQMAIYTIPFFGKAQTSTLRHWHAGISQKTGATAEVRLMTREPNKGWRVRDILGIHTDGSSLIDSVDMEIVLPVGTDIRLNVGASSAVGAQLYGGFDLEFVYDGWEDDV